MRRRKSKLYARCWCHADGCWSCRNEEEEGARTNERVHSGGATRPTVPHGKSPDRPPRDASRAALFCCCLCCFSSSSLRDLGRRASECWSIRLQRFPLIPAPPHLPFCFFFFFLAGTVPLIRYRADAGEQAHSFLRTTINSNTTLGTHARTQLAKGGIVNKLSIHRKQSKSYSTQLTITFLRLHFKTTRTLTPWQPQCTHHHPHQAHPVSVPPCHSVRFTVPAAEGRTSRSKIRTAALYRPHQK